MELDKQFWEEMYNRHPRGVKYFYTWMIDYKNKIHWNDLFEGIVDFEDLPSSLQIGIWIDFLREKDIRWNKMDLLKIDWRYDIESFLKNMQYKDQILL